ncbi:hypothetical protein FA09DRAFT_260360 [Tilletiopsis washingtonensis]|uniref:Secreted protein n=1 Tax=Tilletiopsis washingtonensis TaxID=58919 RepID=A0A316ZBN3_9BASI|nr:hypothetical protein FA09DRAFT_260360 [Tilletiopsis washingtonensis]PWN98961.1 hypothetical protein FA09DRAFT_260360 [Tilletiopsis washingtonensis]
MRRGLRAWALWSCFCGRGRCEAAGGASHGRGLQLEAEWSSPCFLCLSLEGGGRRFGSQAARSRRPTAARGRRRLGPVTCAACTATLQKNAAARRARRTWLPHTSPSRAPTPVAANCLVLPPSRAVCGAGVKPTDFAGVRARTRLAPACRRCQRSLAD